MNSDNIDTLNANVNINNASLYELQYQVENNSMVIKTNSDYIVYKHPDLPVPECFNYEVLNDARRHYTKDGSGKFLCDNVNANHRNFFLLIFNNWKGRNFYRVMAPAGTKIKEGCVAGDQACSTFQQGYITAGTHPTLLNERSKMTVCFKGSSVCPPRSCQEEVEIEAINCGSYYVYDLPNIDRCAAYCAYCTE